MSCLALIYLRSTVNRQAPVPKMCILLVRHFESCLTSEGSSVQHTRKYLIRCSLPNSPDLFTTGFDRRFPCLRAVDQLEEWYQQQCPECSGQSTEPHVKRTRKEWTFGSGPDDDHAIRSYTESLRALFEACLRNDGNWIINEQPNLEDRGQRMLNFLQLAMAENVCRDVPEHGWVSPFEEHQDEFEIECRCLGEATEAMGNFAVEIRRTMTHPGLNTFTVYYDGTAEANDMYSEHMNNCVAGVRASLKQMAPVQLTDPSTGDIICAISQIRPFTEEQYKLRSQTLMTDFTSRGRALHATHPSLRPFQEWIKDDGFVDIWSVLDMVREILVVDRGLSLRRARRVWKYFARMGQLNINEVGSGGGTHMLQGVALSCYQLAWDIHAWAHGAEHSETGPNFFFETFMSDDNDVKGNGVLVRLAKRRVEWECLLAEERGRVILALDHMFTLVGEMRAKMSGEQCVVCQRMYCVENDDGIGAEEPVTHRACPFGEDGMPHHVIGKRCYLRIACQAGSEGPRCPYCRREYRTPSPPLPAGTCLLANPSSDIQDG